MFRSNILPFGLSVQRPEMWFDEEWLGIKNNPAAAGLLAGLLE